MMTAPLFSRSLSWMVMTGLSPATKCVPLSQSALPDASSRAHETISDAITDAPGTFEKTLVGLDHLHAHADVDLVINFVITRRNPGELVPFVRLVAARWPRASANISFVAASSDVVPHDAEMVPRYGEVMPQLAEAAAEARRLGVDLRGFESMCGIPLCLVPDEVRPAVVATRIVVALLSFHGSSRCH